MDKIIALFIFAIALIMIYFTVVEIVKEHNAIIELNNNLKEIKKYMERNK